MGGRKAIEVRIWQSLGTNFEEFREYRKKKGHMVKEQIPHGERTYMAVPYEERDQAKASGTRWDAVKKA